MQMNHVAEMVSQDLHLDMSRILNVLLNENRAVAEVFLSLARGAFQLMPQVFLLPDNVHSLAASTRSSLNQDRIGQSVSHGKDFLMAAHRAKSHWNAMFYGHLPRLNLIAHQSNGLDIRAYENQIVSLASLNQFRAFGKETIARMDGISTGIQSRINDFSYIKIGILQNTATQRAGFVGHTTVQGIGVVVSEDRHRSDMQLAQCLDDTHRNLAAIGNQDFIDFFTVHIAIMTPQIYKKKDNLCRLSF